jgi:hypothetical protein
VDEDAVEHVRDVRGQLDETLGRAALDQDAERDVRRGLLVRAGLDACVVLVESGGELAGDADGSESVDCGLGHGGLTFLC